MPDQILIAESALVTYERRFRRHDQVAAWVMRRLGPCVMMLLVVWALVCLLVNMPDEVAMGAYFGVVLAWLIGIFLLYRWRKRAHEALAVIDRVRARGPIATVFGREEQ